MNEDNDKTLLETSLDALNESIEHLDAHTLSRLNQMRQKALSQKTSNSLTNTLWLPAGSMAMLFIAVVVGSLFLSTTELSLNDLDEAEFMATNEEIGLMEDLEFVTWLIEEGHAS